MRAVLTSEGEPECTEDWPRSAAELLCLAESEQGVCARKKSERSFDPNCDFGRGSWMGWAALGSG